MVITIVEPNTIKVHQFLQINISDNQVLGVGIESSLLIPMTSARDGGRYLCSAELNGVNITAEAYLSVIART